MIYVQQFILSSFKTTAANKWLEQHFSYYVDVKYVVAPKRLFFITETITRLPITSDLIVPPSFPIKSNPISDDNCLGAYDEVDDDNGLVPGVYGVYDGCICFAGLSNPQSSLPTASYLSSSSPLSS